MRENRPFKARELVLGWSRASSSQGPLLDIKHGGDVTSSFDCLKLNVGDKEPRGLPFLEPPFVHFNPPPPSPPPPTSRKPPSTRSPFTFFFSICFVSSSSSSSSPSSAAYLANVTKRFDRFRSELEFQRARKKKSKRFNRARWAATELAKQSPNYFSTLFDFSLHLSFVYDSRFRLLHEIARNSFVRWTIQTGILVW